MLKRLKDIGEFGFIKEISRIFPHECGVVKGVGDDAAVLAYKKNEFLLFTTDMLIENVHFSIDTTTAFLIGRKALAINISDIIAMGGIPTYAVIALGLPPNLNMSFASNLIKGIKNIADDFKIYTVGGDTNRSKKIIISISLLGKVKKGDLVLRSGAKVGDSIFVTGALGGSLKSGKHLKFTPRFREARYLIKNFSVNSMMDISDGLAEDLHRIAESSNVGLSIIEESIPCNKGVSIKEALRDGEDFELLFTVSNNEAARIHKTWRYDTKITKIGTVTDNTGIIEIVDNRGKKKSLKRGFRHF